MYDFIGILLCLATVTEHSAFPTVRYSSEQNIRVMYIGPKSELNENPLPGVKPMFLSRFSSTMDRLFPPPSATRMRTRSLAGSTKPPPPIPAPPPSTLFGGGRWIRLGLFEEVDKLWTELDRDGTGKENTDGNVSTMH